MTIKLYRLVTGEDVISDVKERLDSTSNDDIVLDNPATIMIQQNKDGNVGVAIAPYGPLMRGDVYLKRSAVVAEGFPDEKLENEYRARFGSGIVLPQMNLTQ
jgi:hypothetical protein